MGIIKELGEGQGYLKAGFQGFPASGKTYTAVELALGVREFFKLDGPIGFFDTEGGSEYVAKRVREKTGKALVGVRSRAFSDMVQFGRECLEMGVSVAITDSVTHTWRELCASYLSQVNERRRKFYEDKGWKKFTPQKNMEFQDWSTVKGMWNDEWTAFYLNSPMHMIICGRSGYEYDFTEDEESGKRELTKTGTKMRTEGEFGFEPSLSVEMDRISLPIDGGKGKRQRMRMVREATIIKDRFNAIDGATCINPTFKFFLPHVRLLTPGQHAPVDTDLKTDTGADQEGGDAWARERKTRQILAEEIVGLLQTRYPSQTAADKQGRMGVLHEVFDTRSWTAVEGMDSKRLREGLAHVRELLNVPANPEPEAKADEPAQDQNGQKTE